MSFPLRVALMLAIASSAALPVSVGAASIQRCEGNDGRVTYSDTDCPANTRRARAVDTSPPVEPGAQKAARDRARRDAKALADLEAGEAREREVQQRLLAKAQARDEKCARLRLRVELARDELDAEKLSNRRPPLQRKLERASREHEVACPKR